MIPEPTEAMIEAGVREMCRSDMVQYDSRRALDHALVTRIYLAMEAAREPVAG
jgi:hypothetical protein